MKKWKILMILIIMIIFGNNKVLAKDTVYSINKYQEETLNFIKSSYNKNGKKDGMVTGGYYLKEELTFDNTTYQDYQIILVKYKTNGDIVWTYTYGKAKEDKIEDLQYTYDENNKVDGYLVVLEKTNDITNNEEQTTEEDIDQSNTTLLKIGLDGKLIWEKSSNLNSKENIQKIIPVQAENNTQDGYLAIAYQEENEKKIESYIIRYDRELNVLWSKKTSKEENQEIEYLDVVTIIEDGNLLGYAFLQKITNAKKETNIQLLRRNTEGEEEIILDNDLSRYETYNLQQANNGFLLYGITPEVKLKKSEKSYYIINYNSKNNIEWETIGEVPVSSKKKMILSPEIEKNTIKEYFLSYGNDQDSSYEVIKIDVEGTYLRKVKKILNDYYDYEGFIGEKDILYFVGQINCPEDDNCDYDANSLFLISDEDKVIEVKDNDSKNIILGFGLFIIILLGMIYIKRKKKLIH